MKKFTQGLITSYSVDGVSVAVGQTVDDTVIGHISVERFSGLPLSWIHWEETAPNEFAARKAKPVLRYDYIIFGSEAETSS